MSSQVIRMESRRRFVARCGTESMKKCFLPWLTSAIYLDASPGVAEVRELRNCNNGRCYVC